MTLSGVRVTRVGVVVTLTWFTRSTNQLVSNTAEAFSTRLQHHTNTLAFAYRLTIMWHTRERATFFFVNCGSGNLGGCLHRQSSDKKHQYCIETQHKNLNNNFPLSKKQHNLPWLQHVSRKEVAYSTVSQLTRGM